MTTRAHFEHLLEGLPAVSTVEQWESLVAKVGGKVFCLCTDAGHLVFKLPETSFEILTAANPAVSQAPYFAKRNWVSVAPGALAGAELTHYLAGAHYLVANSLTKKLQRELGLLPPA